MLVLSAPHYVTSTTIDQNLDVFLLCGIRNRHFEKKSPWGSNIHYIYIKIINLRYEVTTKAPSSTAGQSSFFIKPSHFFKLMVFNSNSNLWESPPEYICGRDEVVLNLNYSNTCSKGPSCLVCVCTMLILLCVGQLPSYAKNYDIDDTKRWWRKPVFSATLRDMCYSIDALRSLMGISSFSFVM